MVKKAFLAKNVLTLAVSIRRMHSIVGNGLAIRCVGKAESFLLIIPSALDCDTMIL